MALQHFVTRAGGLRAARLNNLNILGPRCWILELSSRFQGENFTENPNLQSNLQDSGVQGQTDRKNDFENHFLIRSPPFFGLFIRS